MKYFDKEGSKKPCKYCIITDKKGLMVLMSLIELLGFPDRTVKAIRLSHG